MNSGMTKALVAGGLLLVLLIEATVFIIDRRWALAASAAAVVAFAMVLRDSFVGRVPGVGRTGVRRRPGVATAVEVQDRGDDPLGRFQPRQLGSLPATAAGPRIHAGDPDRRPRRAGRHRPNGVRR